MKKSITIISIINMSLIFTYLIVMCILFSKSYVFDNGNIMISKLGISIVKPYELVIYCIILLTSFVSSLLILLLNINKISSKYKIGYKLKTTICNVIIVILSICFFSVGFYLRLTSYNITGDTNAEDADIMLIEYIITLSILILFLIISGNPMKKLQILFLVLQTILFLCTTFFYVIGVISPVSWAIIFVWIIMFVLAMILIVFSIANLIISIINYNKTNLKINLVLFIISIILIALAVLLVISFIIILTIKKEA